MINPFSKKEKEYAMLSVVANYGSFNKPIFQQNNKDVVWV